MKRELRELDVPEHREGFWNDLAGGLANETQELPVGGDRRGPRGWVLAPAAAVIVVVAVAGVSGLLGGEGPVEDPVRDGPVPFTTTSLAAETTTSTPQSLPDAPWSVPPPVPVDAAPPELVEEWSTAENRMWCSALTVTDPEIVSGHQARAAEFSGGWGVAWDSPDRRSVFGVAGAGLVREIEMTQRWPDVRHYADGSTFGYGGEGLDETNPRRLAEMIVGGQGCMYQVWSDLGDDHLLAVIGSLRFVEGLQAEPVELVDDVEIRDGGEAPWSAAAVEVPDVVDEARSAAGISGPLLWPTTVGFDDVAIRVADVAAWSVTWDVAGEPGHDAFNFPCSNCGRGVVGFGEYAAAEALSVPAGLPLRIDYEDGSYVEIGYYVGDDRLPADRLQFADRETGELVPAGYRARIVRADTFQEYVLWSHRGLDHLLELVDGLRHVSG